MVASRSGRPAGELEQGGVVDDAPHGDALTGAEEQEAQAERDGDGEADGEELVPA